MKDKLGMKDELKYHIETVKIPTLVGLIEMKGDNDEDDEKNNNNN